ncbi:hypothetical protein IG631_00092 [Alternaria alternata]|nr:hypothetical protein IG631_00092 [Alternaria alternata]
MDTNRRLPPAGPSQPSLVTYRISPTRIGQTSGPRRMSPPLHNNHYCISATAPIDSPTLCYNTCEQASPAFSDTLQCSQHARAPWLWTRSEHEPIYTDEFGTSAGFSGPTISETCGAASIQEPSEPPWLQESLRATIPEHVALSDLELVPFFLTMEISIH